MAPGSGYGAFPGQTFTPGGGGGGGAPSYNGGGGRGGGHMGGYDHQQPSHYQPAPAARESFFLFLSFFSNRVFVLY